FLGVGEEEPSHSGRRLPQLGVAVDLVEPLRHGAACQVGGNRRIPPLFAQTVAAGQTLELIRQPIPAGRTPAPQETPPAARGPPARSRTRRAAPAPASAPVLSPAAGFRPAPGR